MSEFHYALGLDIGIASVGWAVLRHDESGEPNKIQDLGVRIFDTPEHPKTGASLAAPRREARGTRRRLRRHRHRLERIRSLLELENIITQEELQAIYETGGQMSPYQLRAEALDRALNQAEFARVLIHLAQRRGYQSNSTAEEAKNSKETGKMKTALKENRERLEKNGYRTVGEMMYRDTRFWKTLPDGSRYHQTRNKAGDYRFTVERSLVLSEIEKIFAAQQAFHVPFVTEKLKDDYLKIFSGQRGFDEGPGEGSPFRGGIADKVGVCTFEKEPPEPRAAKATYTFEYFKLLQDLNHLRLIGQNGSRQLRAEERELLKTAALQSSSLTYGNLRKKLNLPETVLFAVVHYGDKGFAEAEKRSWCQMQSYHKIRNALNKVSKNAIQTLSIKQLDAIGTILSIYKSDNARIAALTEAKIPAELIPALLMLSFSKFGNLSVKAMEKLIPYLEQGVRYDQACAAVYGDHFGKQRGEKKGKLSLADIEEITNPVVRRAVSQTIKVVNAIVSTYGNPDVVRIELSREMGHSFEERNDRRNRQEKNRKSNEQAKAHIMELKGDAVTGIDIVKYKLYQEQDGVCLYSGKNLDISRLFEKGYVEVDHIIPYSRSFDDSYANKVLVLAEENQKKGNRLPYEYFGQDESRWHAFTVRMETIIRSRGKRQKLLRTAFTEEDSREMIERNIKDTQYITTVIYNFLRDYMVFADSSYRISPVQAVNGGVTASLRKRWGIEKIREDGDLHHCLDAAVIAVTSPGMIHRLTKFNQQREEAFRWKSGYVDSTTGELMTKKAYDEKYAPAFPKPWERFREELIARVDPDPQAALDRLHLPTYETDEVIKPVFVSRMPKHKVTGAAHQDTIRSGKMPGYTVTKTALQNLKLDKDGEIHGYYNKESDRLLYEALRTRLQEFGGDGKKAFAEPFYKPKRDGTPGPCVNKVKIYEKSSLNVPICGGIAANGDMLRIDVFHVAGDGYYFVPIYVADTRKAVLPSKAAVAHKSYEEWKEMLETDFLFSLYPGDLVRIRSKKAFRLSQVKNGTGEKEIERTEGLFYYRGAGIGSGTIVIDTHDRRYSQPSLGVKTLLSIEKFQVDVLGNYYPVRSPERRMGFHPTR